MFGFLRRSKPRPDPVLRNIAEKIVYGISDDDNADFRKSRHTPMPLLPFGQRNSSCPKWMLDQLDNHWKCNWMKLDLDKIFYEEELTASELPIPPVKPVLKLKEEDKVRLKGIVLGELKKIEHEKL